MEEEMARYLAKALPALARHSKSPLEDIRWVSDGQGGGWIERFMPPMRVTFHSDPPTEGRRHEKYNGKCTAWLGKINYDRVAIVNEEWWVAYVRHAVHTDIVVGIWQHCDGSGYLPLVFKPGTLVHGFEPEEETSANYACVYGPAGRSRLFKHLKTLTEAISMGYEEGSPWYWFPTSDKPVPPHWEWFFRTVQQVRIDRDSLDEHLESLAARGAV